MGGIYVAINITFSKTNEMSHSGISPMSPHEYESVNGKILISIDNITLAWPVSESQVP